MGGYPTTTVLDAPGSAKILGDKSNATVQELSMLLGVGGDGDLGDDHILSNRLFTTVVGGYTNVPTEAQFGMFREAIVRYRRDLVDAGVQVSRRLRRRAISRSQPFCTHAQRTLRVAASALSTRAVVRSMSMK